MALSASDVTNYYQTTLGRDPTAADLSYWTGGTGSAPTMADLQYAAQSDPVYNTLNSPTGSSLQMTQYNGQGTLAGPTEYGQLATGAAQLYDLQHPGATYSWRDIPSTLVEQYDQSINPSSYGARWDTSNNYINNLGSNASGPLTTLADVAKYDPNTANKVGTGSAGNVTYLPNNRAQMQFVGLSPTASTTTQSANPTWLQNWLSQQASPNSLYANLFPQSQPNAVGQAMNYLQQVANKQPVQASISPQDQAYYRYGFGPQQVFIDRTDPTGASLGVNPLASYASSIASQRAAGAAAGGLARDVPMKAIGQSPLMAISQDNVAQRYMRGGRGGGQDDTIPARLSKNEYVMDADVVSALGDGSPDEGARKLDAFREAVREHKRSAPASKIPPKAKSIDKYMKGA